MLVSSIIWTIGVVQCSHYSGESAIVASKVSLGADYDTLQYVQVVWRHGDRTPSSVLPSDKEGAKKWVEGLGELTRKGIAQQYRLGQWLRRRYGAWLGGRFDRNEVYIRSSDYNRTLMSAQANMAGLFPPANDEVWDRKLSWQPVPVHSLPRELDKQLYEEIHCPTAELELEKIWQSKTIRDIEKRNANILQFLSDKTGIVDFKLNKLWAVYDNLFCEEQHNDTHQWPKWANYSLFNRITYLYDISSQFEFHTEILRRLRGGPLLKEIYERFITKKAGLLGSKPKFFAYSAHDTTIAALLATLGIFPDVFPRYATMVILEMHIRDGNFVLELFHKNGTDSDELFRYEVADCDKPCTLEKFISNFQRYFPVHWEKECGLGNSDMGYIIAITVLAITTVIFGGILALDLFLKYNKKPRFQANEPLIETEP